VRAYESGLEIINVDRIELEIVKEDRDEAIGAAWLRMRLRNHIQCLPRQCANR
jgi:hypothetical protein